MARLRPIACHAVPTTPRRLLCSRKRCHLHIRPLLHMRWRIPRQRAYHRCLAQAWPRGPGTPCSTVLLFRMIGGGEVWRYLYSL